MLLNDLNFIELDKLIWECNIKRKNIYNVDETGSSIEMFQRKHVIVNNWNEISARENWIWEIGMGYYDEVRLCR